MIAQHMRFTAGAVILTGDFLAHAGDWTSLPASELLSLMRLFQYRSRARGQHQVGASAIFRPRERIVRVAFWAQTMFGEREKAPGFSTRKASEKNL
jgi:hypothetical protein